MRFYGRKVETWKMSLWYGWLWPFYDVALIFFLLSFIQSFLSFSSTTNTTMFKLKSHFYDSFWSFVSIVCSSTWSITFDFARNNIQLFFGCRWFFACLLFFCQLLDEAVNFSLLFRYGISCADYIKFSLMFANTFF